MIVYGPSQRGKSLAAWPSPFCLYSHLLWKVLNITLSPTLYVISDPQEAFVEEAWYNLASSKLSLASAMSSVTRLMIFSVAEAAEWRSGGNKVGTIGGIS